MQGRRPRGPRTRGRAVFGAEESRLVDDNLDVLFGSQFSRVIEHHFRVMAGAGFCTVLAADPAGARGTMRTILGSDRAVDVVFRALRRRLRAKEGDGCSEGVLRALLSRSISKSISHAHCEEVKRIDLLARRNSHFPL